MTKNSREHYSIFLPVKAVTSTFAKNAIELSPYQVPDNLSTAIIKFQARLEEVLGNRIAYHGKWINGQITRQQWNRIISMIITDKRFVEVHQWNQRKNGNDSPFSFVTATSYSPDPDNDFIDLDALAINVARETWYRAVPEDEPKDANACKVIPSNGGANG